MLIDQPSMTVSVRINAAVIDRRYRQSELVLFQALR
jgi:hypothetical protein